MKRIELNTGVAERGYWDGEKFDYKMRLQVASYDYNFSEEEYIKQFGLAKEFVEKSGGSPNTVEAWDIGSSREVFLFEKENVDEIVKDSDAEEFLIYLETNRDKLFVCTTGIRSGSVPKEGYTPAGDYKKFTKADLKQGYESEAQRFETNSQSRGAIKLHIFPLKPIGTV